MRKLECRNPTINEPNALSISSVQRDHKIKSNSARVPPILYNSKSLISQNKAYSPMQAVGYSSGSVVCKCKTAKATLHSGRALPQGVVYQGTGNLQAVEYGDRDNETEASALGRGNLCCNPCTA